MDDILVMHANMGGFPSLSMPIGFNSEHLPIGLQIIGNTMDEATIYQLASFIEKEIKEANIQEPKNLKEKEEEEKLKRLNPLSRNGKNKLFKSAV
mgnify:CR=1 FL=1